MSERPLLLLVDDEPRILSALRRTLRREGYEIITAESSSEALELLAERPVALVVSDQKMRGMNGLEFLEAVARRHPGVGRLLLTGWPEEVPAHQLEQLGIQALIPKPWDDTALKDAIRRALPPA